jgi:hypothetical protein
MITIKPGLEADAVRAAIERAIGGAAAAIETPIGTTVHVSAEALAAHVPPARSPFVPFIREAIEDPFEIWLRFERHRATGKVVLRQRLVKQIALDRARMLLLVLQAINGRLEAWTFLPVRTAGYLAGQRLGQLLFRRRDGKSPEQTEGPPGGG